MSSAPYYKDFPTGATSSSLMNRADTPEYPPSSTSYGSNLGGNHGNDYGGADHSSQRGILRDSYPPGNSGSSELGTGEKFGGIGDYSYEKGDNSVMTRGKVAAQVSFYFFIV